MAMVLAGAVPLLAGTLLETKLKGVLGDCGYDSAQQGFAVLALLSIAVVGVAHDSARAAVVTRYSRGPRSGALGCRDVAGVPVAGTWRVDLAGDCGLCPGDGRCPDDGAHWRRHHGAIRGGHARTPGNRAAARVFAR